MIIDELWSLWREAVRAKDWDAAKKYAAIIDQIMILEHKIWEQ